MKIVSSINIYRKCGWSADVTNSHKYFIFIPVGNDVNIETDHRGLRKRDMLNASREGVTWKIKKFEFLC